MALHEVQGKADFESQLQKAGSKLVVVDVYATWCGPCKNIAPHFQRLADKFKATCTFLKMDSDKNQEIAGELGIRAIPTFLFYHKGKPLERMQGADPAALESAIEKFSKLASPFGGAGAGHSLLGPSPAAGAGAGARPSPAPPSAAAAAGAGAGAGAGGARKNPWADPNFVPPGMRKSESKEAPKPAASSAASKPASAAPAAAAPAKPSSAAPASSSASSSAPKPSPATQPAAKPPAAAPVAPKPAEQPKPAPAAAPKATAASANDARLQVDDGLLAQMLDMGFSKVRAEKALILTKSKSLEEAINWLDAHENDKDIDEPLQLVGSAPAAGPANANVAGQSRLVAAAGAGKKVDPDLAPIHAGAPNLDDDLAEMDEEMKRIVAAAGKAGGEAPVPADEAPPKKPISEMTSEEKMAWLEERRELAKKKRAAREAEAQKDSEKNRQSLGKAALELQRQREEDMMKRAYEDKQKELRAKNQHHKEIMEKIKADKERRKREQEAEMARVAKAKAEAAAQKK